MRRYLSRGPRKGMRQDRSPSLGKKETTHLVLHLPQTGNRRKKHTYLTTNKKETNHLP